MKYDGKDSAEISCDEFLEMPIRVKSGGADPTDLSIRFKGTAHYVSSISSTLTRAFPSANRRLTRSPTDNAAAVGITRPASVCTRA